LWHTSCSFGIHAESGQILPDGSDYRKKNRPGKSDPVKDALFSGRPGREAVFRS
jgi:hypothetical protein